MASGTKEKALGLYTFIKELVATKHNVVADIKKQPWHKYISSIHEDSKHISLPHYLDTEDEQVTAAVLLQVQKPHFDHPPEVPGELLEWLDVDYKNFTNELRCKYFIQKEDETILDYADNPEIAELFNEYKKDWDKWAQKQKIYDSTRRLYNDLFRLREELKANPETLEFVVGNGEISVANNIKHPMITKKIAIEFDEASNSLQILDTDSDTQFYNELFPNLEDISTNSIKTYREILADNQFHPLSEQDTKDFLSPFSLKLSSDTVFIDNIDAQASCNYRIVIRPNPVFFLRKKIDGTLQFIERIIDDIKDDGNLTPSLPPILGTHDDREIQEYENPKFEQELAALNGESLEVLLSKPANREQLQIAERIQKENVVVVQGPPGTGKTHTIANILGHFLADGKSVLVTSQKSKALSVLQRKLPDEIKGLCVSVFDDGVSEVERSVNEISTRISTTNSVELSRKIELAQKSRNEIINLLDEKRKKMFAIKFQEFEPLTYNGERYKPLNMAKEVAANEEFLKIIPSNVDMNAAFPLELNDLHKLYATNEIITSFEEDVLALGIPNPANFAFESVVEFERYIGDSQKIKQELSDYRDKNSDFDFREAGMYKNEQLLTRPTTKEALISLKNKMKGLESLEQWAIQAVGDGKQGGGFRERWLILKNQIEYTAKFTGKHIASFLGKTFDYAHYGEQEVLLLLTKLSEILSQGKIGMFTFLGKKNLKEFYEIAAINGIRLKTSAECKIFKNYIELISERKELANLWNALMTPLDVPKFEALDEHPEMVAKNYCPKIEKYLDWHNNEHQDIMKIIKDCGIIVEEFFKFDDSMPDGEKLEKTVEIFNNEISALIPVMQDYFEVKDISSKYNELNTEFSDKKKKMIEMLTTEERINSDVCSKMAEAVKNHDADSFGECYKEISRLNSKYEAQNFRNHAIEKISKVAPAWAQAIQNRDGIHGEKSVQENILNAWKYRQFAAILDDITKESFEELQKETVRLSRELRKATEKLVAYKAWYHVLLRIEGNNSMRQSLIGWLQTIKKIGKGTGKKAPMLKRKSRENMLDAQKAVPAWIMPITKVMDNYSPDKNKFDVIIIDEASQSDVSALGLFYMADKIIVVGDDKQVSPSAIGMVDDKIKQLRAMYIEGKIPNDHLYDGTTSLYDIAMTTFQPLMLKEHFRCVPDIINYSNRLSYDGKIKPLRDTNGVQATPHLINYSVNGRRNGKANKTEAETIVSIIKACTESEEYKDKAFGVISLLGNEKGEQASLIQTLISERLDLGVKEKHNLRVGAAPDFQGDERDIMFLTMVDSNENDGPLRLSDIEKKEAKQRYNVAVSRARDQIWIVNSLDPSRDLKANDIRKDLLEYANDPKLFSDKILNVKAKSESPFEREIAEFLVNKNYNIIQQWEVGAYRIDMVVSCGNKKIALECDGECYHSTEEQVKNDMERQTILERLGWNFIRIRGSEFYRNKEKTFERLTSELQSYDIYPEEMVSQNKNESSLLEKIKIRAAQIREEWEAEYDSKQDEVIATQILLFSNAEGEDE